MRTRAGNALFFGLPNGGLNNTAFLVAKQAILAGMGVEPCHADARFLNVEQACESLMSQSNGPENCGGGQHLRDITESQVGGRK